MPEIWSQHYHTIYYPKGCYLTFLYYGFFILKARTLSPPTPLPSPYSLTLPLPQTLLIEIVLSTIPITDNE